MKWKINRNAPKDLTEWHKVFAWKPIVIGEYKYWLCFVYARMVDQYGKGITREIYLDILSRSDIHSSKDWPWWEYQEVTMYY